MRGGIALGTVAALVLLTGCGHSDRPGTRIHGRTLTIYFSGPQHGASSMQAGAALDGARLALAHAGAHIGPYRIRFRALDDSTLASAGWDPNQTTLGVRRVLQDPTAIGYLGDFNSGASAVSIPLLNRAGVPQISPGSSAVGLTTSGPGRAPGEPEKYYPSGVRTFARVVPTDAQQSVALVRAQQAYGCHTIFVLEDAEFDGEDAALTYVLTAKAAGLHVVTVQAFQRGALDYTGMARTVATSGAECVLISAIDERSSVRLTKQVARAVPSAMIFVTSGLADAAYLDPGLGGLPSALDDRIVVVCPMLPPAAYQGAARTFLTGYTRRFGAPQPAAIFGYQAMSLLLSAIVRATDNGRRAPERAKVRAEIFSDREIHGVLGSFRIDRAGDISITRYGIYTVQSGRLIPWSGTGAN